MTCPHKIGMIHVALVQIWPVIKNHCQSKFENYRFNPDNRLTKKLIPPTGRAVVIHVLKYRWGTHSENGLTALLSTSLGALLQSDDSNKCTLWYLSFQKTPMDSYPNSSELFFWFHNWSHCANVVSELICSY